MRTLLLLLLLIAPIQSATLINSYRFGGGGGTIAFRLSGTFASGATSIAVPFPATPVSGELFVLTVANKYPANSPSTPAGWTLAGQGSGGQGVPGPSSGTCLSSVYYKISDGTESGNLTVTITSGNTGIARMFAYSKTGGTWDVAVSNGADNTAGTDWSATAAADPGAIAGDFYLACSAINGANGSSIWSTQAITQSGITVWGTVAERQDSGTGTGDDVSLVVSEHPVTTGTSSAAPVFTMTASTSGADWPAGNTVFLRLRLN